MGLALSSWPDCVKSSTSTNTEKELIGKADDYCSEALSKSLALATSEDVVLLASFRRVQWCFPTCHSHTAKSKLLTCLVNNDESIRRLMFKLNVGAITKQRTLLVEMSHENRCSFLIR
ncbi:hypothetical protein L596_029664 [Steinernema carpocapsae]|uniref:Uncharacterized protein n=1 Tax=Steinernema carpocapsae TaxID=34508 RepID=A0A4U5LVB0_STECR|nr:hypothetical protein L596_029664 [Steinernema carpocapsae]